MRRRLQTRYQPILIGVGILIIVFAGYFLFDSSVSEQGEFIEADAPIPLDQIEDRVEDGMHVTTGLLDGEGLHLVIAHCTACHSAQLITQNRADKAGWKKMIRWMQETQNLWELGTQEEIILDYLATYYAPEDPKGAANFRRVPLQDIEWYELRD
ncbi:MAG: hypothetical protein JJU34_11615 [Lunatimonas sp.]|uniref:hypothetical protein n=1 Tax=Lunatimonas sp. TaxID=2060141 RepID=UPI00263B5032|nr:hypothetical protein [Lunatimonas sp.]MCC5937918.1 hypothetical protein [Lunatimonas sp.]